MPAQSFKDILDRYTRTKLLNTRKSAQALQGLANQGSFGAALTAGLLNSQADRADAQTATLAAALQGEQLDLDERRVAASELTAQSNARNADARTDLVGKQVDNFDEDAETIRGLNRAKTAGLITDTAYQSMVNGVYAKYGSVQAKAEVEARVAQTNASNASARNTTANAVVTEQTGVATAKENIRASQVQTKTAQQNANTNSGRLGLDGKKYLESIRQYDGTFAEGLRRFDINTGIAEKQAGVSQQNANTSAGQLAETRRRNDQNYSFNKLQLESQERQAAARNATQLQVAQSRGVGKSGGGATLPNGKKLSDLTPRQRKLNDDIELLKDVQRQAKRQPKLGIDSLHNVASDKNRYTDAQIATIRSYLPEDKGLLRGYLPGNFDAGDDEEVGQFFNNILFKLESSLLR